MARSAAVWMKLECGNADILFRDHWAGLVEVACGESRVMVSYSGRERLAKLPPEALIHLLRSLLEVARAERRNHDSAELLAAYLEQSLQQDSRPLIAPLDQQ
jgi:hypothetical protein